MLDLPSAVQSSLLLLLEVIPGVTQAFSCDNGGEKNTAILLEDNLAIPIKRVMLEMHMPFVPDLLLLDNHVFGIFAQVDKMHVQWCSLTNYV